MKSKSLREWRKSKGLTQEGLADKSGVDQSTISNLEIGRASQPTFTTACKLARALRIRPEALSFSTHTEASR